MSLNFSQIWVSPLLQEAGGRGRCWAESSTWFPAGNGSEAALPSGSTAGCLPGSVLLSSPHLAALVLGSWGVGTWCRPTDTLRGDTLPWLSPVSVLAVGAGVFGHR